MYRTLPGRSVIGNPIGPISGGPRQNAGALPMPGPMPMGRILGGFKKGGKVKKTGNYKLHKGERVVPKGGKMKLSALRGKDRDSDD